MAAKREYLMPETDKVAVVITSINKPGPALQLIAEGCLRMGHEFFVIGDEAGPAEFHLEGCRFFNLPDQQELGFKLAQLSPTRHYARKNIGYLLAMQSGAKMILDLDDDCTPNVNFWLRRNRHQTVRTSSEAGWVNVYRYFSEAQIWPRGFPLDKINDAVRPFETLPAEVVDCPIQNGLSDGDPDVDAIYRLISPSLQDFRRDRCLALKTGSWSPFNTQNTAWWSDAFLLLYLPAFCSFRMTDIWRSFVAQRIAWANDWGILFHGPNITQERNPHDLMRDFADELPGYLNNAKICEALSKLQIETGGEHVPDNLRACYAELVRIEVIQERELILLDAWIADFQSVTST